MRLFGSDKVARMMDKMGHKDGEVIQHSLMTTTIERAQKKVEENNFGIRKRLLEYDDVMNLQREDIFTKRKNALDVNRLKVDIANMIYETVESIYMSAKNNNDFKSFEFDLIRYFSITSPFNLDEFENLDQNRIIDDLYNMLLFPLAQSLPLVAKKSFFDFSVFVLRCSLAKSCPPGATK